MMVSRDRKRQVDRLEILMLREGDIDTESDKRDLKKLKTDEDEESVKEKKNATNKKWAICETANIPSFEPAVAIDFEPTNTFCNRFFVCIRQL
ncbi:unnamed protein product [Lactuca virosa]|uniref:Uncharacterized protein n=1 Tax=Lactuca virosa TaxID=75947 RepID=A0AAU9NNC9_9ASTR|nr:unnamed protein product [Lactuca virosa]